MSLKKRDESILETFLAFLECQTSNVKMGLTVFQNNFVQKVCIFIVFGLWLWPNRPNMSLRRNMVVLAFLGYQACDARNNCQRFISNEFFKKNTKLQIEH